MDGEGVGEDQRGAAVRRGVVHRDGDHSAERQAADVRAVDAELVHRRQDRRGIIVAGRAFGRGVAVAVAGIVERDRAARPAEMVELRPPHGFVGADAVEEDDRRRVAAARFLVADRRTRCWSSTRGMRVILAAAAAAALASRA